MNGRYIHTIWCDDIRQEIGNKPSFMGVYNDGLILPSLPFMLPQISVYSWIVTPIENPFKSLEIKACRDDGFVLFQVKIDDVEKVAQPKQEESTRLTAAVGFTLGGIEIPNGCKYIQIKVATENETLDGPKLKIKVDQKVFETYNKNWESSN